MWGPLGVGEVVGIVGIESLILLLRTALGAASRQLVAVLGTHLAIGLVERSDDVGPGIEILSRAVGVALVNVCHGAIVLARTRPSSGPSAEPAVHLLAPLWEVALDGGQIEVEK